MMQLYYEAADGTILNLMQNGIYAQDPEALTQNTWSYTTISGVNGLARVKRFYKNVQTAKLKLSVMAADKEEFNEIMYTMHRIFEKDVRNMTPGRIWWNNFYKEGFVYSTSNDDYEELFESVEHEIEFLSINPSWIRKTTYQYRTQANETGTLDYPRDYGYDYDRSEIIEILNNQCIGESNFELIFYGAAVDPQITIGGNIYGLETTLKDGEYATVNSITKKIRQYSITGEETNIFDKRDRENNIFQKMPEGTLPVLRSKDMQVDITLYDERGEPEWI